MCVSYHLQHINIITIIVINYGICLVDRSLSEEDDGQCLTNAEAEREYFLYLPTSVLLYSNIDESSKRVACVYS